MEQGALHTRSKTARSAADRHGDTEATLTQSGVLVSPSTSGPWDIGLEWLTCLQGHLQLLGQSCSLCQDPPQGEKAAHSWCALHVWEGPLEVFSGYEVQSFLESLTRILIPCLINSGRIIRLAGKTRHTALCSLITGTVRQSLHPQIYQAGDKN